SPGFFDLIIFDEAHRSLFKRFTEVIEYFDARMIGLTATPANFIDRDTFRLFGCDANVPTFLYDYPQAVKDGFLVDFSLYQAHTSFQRKGVKGVDLSEEDRNALAEQGIDPDSLDYAGTEIEVEVSNRDTLRKQWEAGHGDLPQGSVRPVARQNDHLCDDQEACPPHRRGLRGDVPAACGRRAGHHVHDRASTRRQLRRRPHHQVQEEQPAACRDLRGHARHWHRRPGGRKSCVHEASAVTH